MKYAELKRLLKQYGCYKYEEGGNHEKWLSPINNKKFSVGRHDSEDGPKGTFNSILKQAGIKE